MTWFDGGPAPDPTRSPRGSRALEPEPVGWSAPAPPVVPGPPQAPALLAAQGPAAVAAQGLAAAAAQQAPAAAPAARAARVRLRDAAERAGGTGGEALPGDAPPPPWHPLGALAPDTPVTGRPRGWRGGSGLLSAVQWRLGRRTAGVAVLALALVGGAVALRAAGAPSQPVVTVPEPLASATSTPTTGADPASGGDLAPVVWVHVVGRVAAPGLVSLPAGSRVAEAVAAAGGALPDADLAAVNLAAEVVDGAQVHVPAPGEAATAAAPAAGTEDAPDTVDVNAADAGELESLPGIGPVLAERIVTWREEHGPFADVDALQDVPGIGPAVLGQLRSRVRT